MDSQLINIFNYYYVYNVMLSVVQEMERKKFLFILGEVSELFEEKEEFERKGYKQEKVIYG